MLYCRDRYYNDAICLSADLNATIRAMDLLFNIVSPVTVGLVMTAASLTTAAIFIAAWNFCSVFVEYSLLSQVYRLVPQLAVKEDEDDTGTGPAGQSQFFLYSVS